ncbi:MAG: Nudix family hydrolase [Gammaproteobacteria bacterium]
MKTLEVAVGVVKNPEGRVLISLRDPSLHQGGLWEFPGGKIESGETADQALLRELKEELDLTVEKACPLITIRHRYPDRAVRLKVFLVERFRGMPRHSQGQPIHWAGLNELSDYPFPAANLPIITASRLPPCYAILDDADGTRPLEALQRILANGVKLIQARLKSMSNEAVARFADDAHPLCKKHGALLLLNSEAGGRVASGSIAPDQIALGQQSGIDGLHLTSRHLMSQSMRPGAYQWVSASCHTLEELLHAEKIGIDFAVLAPVLPTKTHPDARPLGWEQFARLVARVNIPVYALGGMSLKCLQTAREAGGQGIAGIRAFL